MSDSWSERAAAYRDSPAHREGPDLDLIVEWAVGARTALDVATGGGHVARRLREVGLKVVTTDAAPGMQPDVVSRAEDLPFADGSFDLVVSRLGAHHFADVQAGVSEMARVSADRVIVVDNVFGGEALEEAERVRDPSHVRSYSEDEWRTMLEANGLDVAELQVSDYPVEFQPWLDRAGCVDDDAERVRTLAADRIVDGWITFARMAVKAVKR